MEHAGLRIWQHLQKRGFQLSCRSIFHPCIIFRQGLHSQASTCADLEFAYGGNQQCCSWCDSLIMRCSGKESKGARIGVISLYSVDSTFDRNQDWKGISIVFVLYAHASFEAFHSSCSLTGHGPSRKPWWMGLPELPDWDFWPIFLLWSQRIRRCKKTSGKKRWWEQQPFRSRSFLWSPRGSIVPTCDCANNKHRRLPEFRV